MYTMVPVSDSLMGAVEFICRVEMKRRDDVMKESFLNGVYDELKRIEEDLVREDEKEGVEEIREILAELVMEDET